TLGLGYRAVVERSTDHVTGYIGLVHDPARCASTEAEVGFRLSRRYWGRGYATEVGAAVLSYGMSTLQWPRIIAIIDPENGGSVRVAEKMGMMFERAIMFDGYDHPDHLYAISESQSVSA
ncbi:MAG: GNAT family N-acetyltransferase, partial [Geminicoccaceae bacterium]